MIERNIFIATPCAHGVVTDVYTASLFLLTKSLERSGVKSDLFLNNRSDIVHSRNELASLFLASPEYSHLLFIDSDMGFAPDYVLAMINTDHPFVSTACPRRRLNLQAVVANAPEAKDGDSVQQYLDSCMSYVYEPIRNSQTRKVVFQRFSSGEHQFAVVQGTGSALVLLKREVFESIIAGQQVTKHMDDYYLANKAPYYGFYDKIQQENCIPMSEDFSFCQRWRNVGGEIIMGITPTIQHVGPMCFSGRFLNQLQYVTKEPLG
ncbi:MAG: hypothetical protein M3328_10135 [Chloroflexota bacterium]|nr:hypothetical protein [Chloroflexota bacterium]